MKIAISVIGKTLDSEIDPAFGRCSNFLIVDLKNGTVSNFESVKNSFVESQGLAGVNAVKLIAEFGVDAVITGRIGPRALDALNQFKINAYFGEGIAKNALKLFSEEKLEKIK